MSNNGQNGLPPAVKDWIDRVIVPALVRDYLTRLEPEKSLATSAKPTVESAPARAAIEEGR